MQGCWWGWLVRGSSLDYARETALDYAREPSFDLAREPVEKISDQGLVTRDQGEMSDK